MKHSCSLVSFHCPQRAGAENTCHNSVAVNGCKLYILGISSVTVISLLSWEEVCVTLAFCYSCVGYYLNPRVYVAIET